MSRALDMAVGLALAGAFVAIGLRLRVMLNESRRAEKSRSEG
jgi:hypothetical protein